ncbi:hypothetical protein EH165_14490 [Nakamurella antarctica]|uniref:Uncharacterized protein n=1 Tax=Nakamurella antarctica TaxID=1902245 RepID=A0A3G8ZPL5_9ACTN|nr:NfeD family protein [Nakamurella antarctica]AZI59169.1 hypothetical protein EH165_14490 [Nakamurella antarctica]
MRTDATVTSTSLLGAHGTVITAITSAAAFGEVRLTLGGHTLKYNARSQTPLPVGTTVYVVDVPSSTSVEVVSTAYDVPGAAGPGAGGPGAAGSHTTEPGASAELT